MTDAQRLTREQFLELPEGTPVEHLTITSDGDRVWTAARIWGRSRSKTRLKIDIMRRDGSMVFVSLSFTDATNTLRLPAT